MVRYFFVRIWRVICWIPVIWKTHTWDAGYTLVILRKSLQELCDTITKYGIHCNKARDIKRMRIAINLLDRIIKDDYCLDDSFFTGKMDVQQTHSRETWDQRYLFKLLDKHMLGWWD